ncbi:UDP-N-acetylglucosamine 4,6-dehydratase (inverting) [Synechococcus sp. YX-04-1]|uniref:UDP-N-acetylglucosamine 4,6-dehydratase (inverting) n=1 Tax=Synechococcus sp. YX-04-1 TaxID=3062778 RepID=UPI0026E2F5DF|nr:UDP-N-acetylglucosamine 4,6-dehydratase (inverting) [Synechococcus sp. YX-04-1]MDO6351093.1 UDP-N-acetylglucosamine 4,6-dehydratase (inverting) [Synechococcus sp. YX-04-1]
MRSIVDDAVVLVTGGTGSFGKKFSKYILEKTSIKKLIIFSRDEMKQWNMAQEFKEYSNIRFFLGDVRDKERLNRALSDVDFVIHAAAQKIVPTAEYNPFECIKTNINGAMNVIDCAIDNNVKKVIALSTDKASSPINLYGATKLASDKTFIAANSYSGENNTIFSVVRYGNVMGSRGSVIPFFHKIKNQGVLPITHPDMTRFMITLEQGISLVLHALEDCEGGETYVKKIPSMSIMDIAKAIAPDADIKIIGKRAGEKLHEEMISAHDADFVYEYRDYYKILPHMPQWGDNIDRIKGGVKVDEDFRYESSANDHWMSISDLKLWITNNIQA